MCENGEVVLYFCTSFAPRQWYSSSFGFIFWSAKFTTWAWPLPADVSGEWITAVMRGSLKVARLVVRLPQLFSLTPDGNVGKSVRCGRRVHEMLHSLQDKVGCQGGGNDGTFSLVACVRREEFSVALPPPRPPNDFV